MIWDVSHGPADDASERYSVLETLTEDEAQFIAIARNAFDVMMRRKWRAEQADDGKWFVHQIIGLLPDFDAFVKYTRVTYHDDPFTALVEADKWYAVNVEKKEAL